MRKCKTISFDTTDEIEDKLLQHAESKGNFSRYVKRLIEKDRSGWGVAGGNGIEGIEFEDIKTEIEDEENGDELSGFI